MLFNQSAKEDFSSMISLTCMQSGAYHEVTRSLIEMGISRECAIYLYEHIFRDITLEKNNLKECLKHILRNKINEFPFWIKVQLEFLT